MNELNGHILYADLHWIRGVSKMPCFCCVKAQGFSVVTEAKPSPPCLAHGVILEHRLILIDELEQKRVPMWTIDPGEGAVEHV